MAHAHANRPSFENFSDDLFEIGRGLSPGSELYDLIRERVAARANATNDLGAIWGPYDVQCASEYAVLAGGDRARKDDLLKTLFGTNITAGFMGGPDVYDAVKNHPGARMHTGCVILDRFYRLAEAVGAVQVRSSEHGQRTIRIEDLDGVMARIEDAVGADLPAPKQDGGLFGLRLRGGIYADRHFDGIYAAWRLRELAQAAGKPNYSVCEIGGGAGYVAYYARKLGCRNYAIVDLPQAQIAQYFVLATDYGPHRVVLGDRTPNGLALLAASTPEAVLSKDYDLVVNIDSLPEMPPSVARDYISGITQDQMFLSINQESAVLYGEHNQNVVRNLARDRRLRQVSRFPYWLRTGYVEEVYANLNRQ